MNLHADSQKALFQPVDKYLQNSTWESRELEDSPENENQLPLSIQRILEGNSTSLVFKEPDMFSNQSEMEIIDLLDLDSLKHADDSKPELLSFDEIVHGRFEEFLEHTEAHDWEDLDQDILFGENAVT